MIIELIIAATSHFVDPVGIDEWNEIHPGIQVEFENKFTAGIYHNSIDDTTIFVGRKFDLTDRLELEIGGATGYFDAPVIPFGRLNYDLGNGFDAFAFPIATIDSDGDIADVGLGVGIQYAFRVY